MIYIRTLEDLSWESDKPTTRQKVPFTGQGGEPFVTLRRYEPGENTPPHFHQTDQFQIVLEGEMRFPRHSMGPFGTHYTDAFTAYGPFQAGQAGLLTIGLRREKPETFYTGKGGVRPPKPQGRELFASGDGSWEQVSPELCRRVVLGPGSPEVEVLEGSPGSMVSTGPAPHGAFVVLCKGSCQVSGKPLEAYSIVYAVQPEPVPPIRCGPGGAVLLIARYDRPVGAKNA